MHQLAVAASGGSQFHLWVEPHLKSPRHQPEQLLADVRPGPRRSRRPVTAVGRRELCGYSSPRRPALQLRGQCQGGLAEGHTVKRGRSSLRGSCHPGPFGQISFLFSLYLIPVLLYLVGICYRHVAEHMRMPSNKLGYDAVGYIVDRVPVGTLGRDTRVEYHL
jgi:hypothetical protein